MEYEARLAVFRGLKRTIPSPHERRTSSSSPTGPAAAIRAPAAGAPVLTARGKEREICGGEPHTTNNRMEMRAAIRALEALTRPCRVELHTDSQYLRQGITEWLAGWKGPRLEDRRQEAGEERGPVARTRPRSPAASGGLALGQGPRRPPHERAGRRAGPQGAAGSPRAGTGNPVGSTTDGGARLECQPIAGSRWRPSASACEPRAWATSRPGRRFARPARPSFSRGSPPGRPTT